MAQGYSENEKVYVLELDREEVEYFQRAIAAYGGDEMVFEELEEALNDALEDEGDGE